MAMAARVTMNLVLLGCGGVGRALLHTIIGIHKMHDKVVHLAVVAVSDSSGIVVNGAGRTELDDAALGSILDWKAAGRAITTLDIPGPNVEVRDIKSKAQTDTLVKLLEELGRGSGVVVVDCTASEETGEVLCKAVDMGHCVVLANKKPLSSSLDLHQNLTSAGRRFRCEATVGAALPVLSSLTRLLDVDNVQSITSAPSGTLNYIMTGLQDGKPFSEVVKSAQEFGFTEPDPRDDLSGMDVARKTLIMARHMDRTILMDQVEVESLYPAEMGPTHMSLSEFFEKGLPSLEAKLQLRIEAAAAKDCVLRFTSVIDRSRFRVGLEEVPSNSPLGCLRGTDNLFQIYTNSYMAPHPLVIQGAGAGNQTTAVAVLCDIYDMQDLFRLSPS